MSPVVWCPQCKLPLTGDESAAGSCALCGVALVLPAPAAESAAQPNDGEPSLLTHWPLWVGAGSLVLLTFAIAGVVIGNLPERPGANGNQAQNDDPKPPVDKPKVEESSPVAEVGPPEALKGTAVVTASKAAEFFGPPEELKALPLVGPPEALKLPPFVALRRPVFAGPPEDLKAPLRPVVKPLVVGTETKLDDVEGEFVVEALHNKTLKLTGRVKRLTIGEVNNRATLDASQLEAKEIVILRGIHNDSTVKLNAPNGKVDVRGQVGTRAKVFITAPNGLVTFRDKGGLITNEAKITITAGGVELLDRVQGWNTMVTVTLTAGGRLQYREVTGGSKVHYRKADPKDPDVEILGGDVTNQAEFRRTN